MKPLVVLSVLVCLLLSACGGDEASDKEAGESAAESTGGSESGSQSLEDAMSKINAAMDSGKCDDVAAVVSRTTSGLYEKADDPPKSLCNYFEDGLVPIIEQVDFDRSQQFGSAAIIEGEPAADDPEAKVFVGVVLRDPYADNEWTYTYGGGDTLEQLDTEPTDPEGVQQTAQDFVDSLESQDCEELAASVDPTLNPIPEGSSKDLCQVYFEGPFGKAYADGGSLEYLGGTIDYAFFELTPEDGSRTDTMILNIIGDSEQGKMGVVDVIATPPAEG